MKQVDDESAFGRDWVLNPVLGTMTKHSTSFNHGVVVGHRPHQPPALVSLGVYV